MTLTRETLTRQAFDVLVRRIVLENLAPGARLPATTALAEDLGVSRAVAREALSALQACGFVEISNGRAPVVAGLDGRLIQMFAARAMRLQDRPMSALMEVRAPLEIQAAKLAAERADEDALAQIDTVNGEMAAALHDTERYPQLDTSFHTTIAAAARNHMLMWMADAIRAELMTVMTTVRAYREAEGLVGQEQEQHDEIAEAIRRRNPDQAADAMERHLAASLELVRRVEHQAVPGPT